jgi:mono/diheme cytochrome c family protein
VATAQALGIGLPPTLVPLTVPQRAPDAAAGEPIFIEKCAPCHGESGDGQGPQAAALPNPPAALSDFAVAQRAVPEEWYAIVTEGRIESFMPGFASLDDDQRWDVVGYALSLGLPAQQVDADVLFQGRAHSVAAGEVWATFRTASPISSPAAPSWRSARSRGSGPRCRLRR